MSRAEFTITLRVVIDVDAAAAEALPGFAGAQYQVGPDEWEVDLPESGIEMAIRDAVDSIGLAQQLIECLPTALQATLVTCDMQATEPHPYQPNPYF